MPAANESTARPEELLSVGEMSRRTGMPVSALHYYERLDLIVGRHQETSSQSHASKAGC